MLGVEIEVEVSGPRTLGFGTAPRPTIVRRNSRTHPSMSVTTRTGIVPTSRPPADVGGEEVSLVLFPNWPLGALRTLRQTRGHGAAHAAGHAVCGTTGRSAHPPSRAVDGLPWTPPTFRWMTIELRTFLAALDPQAHCAGEDDLTVRWLTGGYGDVEGTIEYFERLTSKADAGAGERSFGVWMSGQLCGYIDYDPDLMTGSIRRM